MAKQSVKLRIDTGVRDQILKQIASEIGRIGGSVSLNSYYKDPNGGGGGLYGKGSDPVFGKSDPPKSIDTLINVASRAAVNESVAKAAAKIRAKRLRG